MDKLINNLILTIIMNKKDIFRFISHVIFRPRQFNDKYLKEFAKNIKNKKILELGSGKPTKGKYLYSGKRFFDTSNEFIQSDVSPKFGHKVIDATKMDYNAEFDIILAMSILEHIYNINSALKNIYKALKPGGIALFIVPGSYPLHDEPTDYWRFTEHALRKLLSDYTKVKIKHSGIRQYPFMYYAGAVK